MIATSIIKRPVVTERSMKDSANGKFTFIVARRAKKDEIKVAVEKLFGVTVIDVATTMIKGRSVRAGVRRVEIHMSPTKKAVVRLKPGQKISEFEMGA